MYISETYSSGPTIRLAKRTGDTPPNGVGPAAGERPGLGGGVVGPGEQEEGRGGAVEPEGLELLLDVVIAVDLEALEGEAHDRPAELGHVI